MKQETQDRITELMAKVRRLSKEYSEIQSSIQLNEFEKAKQGAENRDEFNIIQAQLTKIQNDYYRS